MKNTLKRLTALLLALSMCLSLLSVNVWAAEPSPDGSVSEQSSEEAPPPEGEDGDRSEVQPEESSDGEGKSEPAPKKNKTDDLVIDTTESEETISVRAKESPKEDLFLRYLEQQTEKDGLKTQAKTKLAGDKLTGAEKKLYQLLEAKIAQIADGELDSTEFTFTGEELGLEQQRYTEAELGVTIIEQGQLTEAAANAAAAKAGSIDLGSVYSALRTDHPYEYYWQDYTQETLATQGYSFSGDTENGESFITCECSTLTVKMPVYSDYAVQGEEYMVNTNIAQSAKQTVDRAQAVVNAHAQKSDLKKLNAYREWICGQVTYNQDAADGGVSASGGNPWQLIWVFDNDESTNVVCEGYSKAFQFLCDLSNFQNNAVYSICASGTMTSGNTSGNHMWNILHMEDGKNYLADVTNCDEGSIGAPNQLFLAAAASGSYADGYTYACQGGDVTYSYARKNNDGTYTYETPKLYSQEELTMSMSADQTPEQGLLAGLIDRIEVGNITRFDTDRDDEGKVNCDPWEDNSVTVKMSDDYDGVVITGNRWSVERKLQDEYCIPVNLDWRTDEDLDDPWTAGQHQAQLVAHMNDGDYDLELCTYNVNVVESPIASVHVDNMEAYETYYNREEYWDENPVGADDENNGEYRHWYNRLDCYPNRIKVTLKDGETKIGNDDEIRAWLEGKSLKADISFDWRSGQDDTHGEIEVKQNFTTAQFSICGVWSNEYNVDVKRSPVASIQVGPDNRVTLLSTQRETVNWGNVSWERYDCWPGRLIVYLNGEYCAAVNSSNIIGDPWDLKDLLQDKFGFNASYNDGVRWESEERPAEDGVSAISWDVDHLPNGRETHTNGATFYFGGAQTSYDVMIMESPIASVHVDDMEVYETYYNEEEYWDENPEGADRQDGGKYRHWYNRLDCYPNGITVTMKDGETKIGNDDEIRAWLEGKNLNVNISFDWRSGQDDTHAPIEAKHNFTTAQFSICGMKSNEYNVTVLESPVEGITVNPITVMSNQRQTVNWEEDRKDWERYDCEPNNITVTVKNAYVEQVGASQKSGKPWEMKDWLEKTLGFNADRGSGKWWESEEHPAEGNNPEYFWVTGENIPDAGKTYENGATYHFGGATAKYDVTIVKALAVEIGDIPDIWRLTSDTDRTWYDGENDEDACAFKRIDCWLEDDITVTVNNKDYTGDLDEIEEQLRKDYPGYRIECGWDSAEKPNRGAAQDEDDCYPGNWTAGKSGNAWVYVLGERQDFTVHVVDINDIIDSVEIDPVNITADYRRPIGDDTDDDGKDDRWWNRLECYPNSVRVKLKGELEGGEQPFYLTWDDGQNTAHLDEIGWRLENYLRNHSYTGIRVRTDWWSDEKPVWNGTPDSEGRYPGDWGAGEYENGAAASIGGFTKTYDVNVTDNPIQSVSVEPITRFETDRERVWDDENQRHWEGINVLPDTEITVTLRDDLNSQPVKGYLYVGADENRTDVEDSLRAALQDTAYKDLEFRADWVTTEECNENPLPDGTYVGCWGVNDGLTEHIARFSLCGVWCDYEVKLIPNPVTTVEIQEQVIPHDRTFEDDGWNYLDCSPINGTVKILLTGDPEDSPSITIQPEELEDNEDYFDALDRALRNKLQNTGRHFPIYWRSAQKHGEMWNHGRYQARLFIFGRPFNYTVLVNDTAHEWDEGEPVNGGSMRLYHCPCGETKSVPVMGVADDVAPGDLTGEGDTTMADVILGNQVVVGLIEVSKEDKMRLDVTGDEDYTMADVVWTNGYVLGKHTTRTKEQS